MNSVLKLVISLSILVMTAFAIIGFQMAKKPPREKENEKQIPLVSTYAAKKFVGELDLSFTGEVVPYKVVTKSTEVAGRIDEKNTACRPGRAVKKGETLIKIDVFDYRVEVDRLNAEVAQSQTMIDELADEINGAEKNVKLVQDEFDLMEQEYERRREIANSLSQSDLATAQRNKITAEKALESAKFNKQILETRQARMKAALDLSKSMLEKAKEDQSRCEIKAPIDGVIVQSDVEAGDYVSKGTAVFTIEDTSRSEVLCSLKLEQLDWLWEHRPDSNTTEKRTAYQPPKVPVKIQADVGAQKVTWTGVLDRYDGIGLEDGTKSVPCIIVVESPVAQTNLGPVALVRGMFVQATVEYQYGKGPEQSTANGLVTFPAGAVQPGNYVWLDNGGRLAKRDVDVVDFVTDESTGKRMAIVNASGEKSIAPGEFVIDTPIANPAELAEIRVLNSGDNSKNDASKANKQTNH